VQHERAPEDREQHHDQCGHEQSSGADSAPFALTYGIDLGDYLRREFANATDALTDLGRPIRFWTDMLDAGV
jgi:hypothetical protein